MRSPRLITPMLLMLVVMASGCHTTASADKPGVMLAWSSEWTGYGEPGPGRIMLYVGGALNHPGRYYLDEGVTLDAIPRVIGDWMCPHCHTTPIEVHLARADGTFVKYRFKEMTLKELQSVHLREGDFLHFLAPHV